MNKSLKNFFMISINLLLIAVLALVLKTQNISVKAEEQINETYYYNQLNDSAKKFYNAFSKMNQDNIFKSGNSYNLLANNVITVEQIKASQNGNDQLLKDFGAGRDAYFLDNPQLFYIDFDKITISISTKGDEYIANIDAGRDSSYFMAGFTKSNIETAINTYNTKINELKTQLNSVNDIVEKIKLANTIICDRTTYSFEGDGSEIHKSQIRTPYGSLVNGYAVCEGYARTFKALMDTQNIQCLEIVGYVYDDNGNLEPHAWNYVNLNNKWYFVDCTYNDGNKDIETYLLLGRDNTGCYIESKTISNSGFEFNYPKLVTFNYGTEEITTLIKYDRSEESYFQDVTYNYKEYKNAKEMQKNGLYLVARHEIFNKDNSYGGWSKSYPIYLTEVDKNEISFNQNTFSTQFLVTSEEPNEFDVYDNLNENLILAKSDVLVNEIYNESANTPRVQKITPSTTSVLDADTTYNITVTYDKLLKIVDENLEIGIYVYNEKSTNLNKYVKVENVRLIGDDTISFTFTPSKMYEHDQLTYKFIPTNIVGYNDCTPHFFSFTFARPWVVCSKIFKDGRLYINSYATPTIIDSQDLSVNGFLDENGNQIAENQLSQLVLVAKKPGEDLLNQMEDNVNSILGDNKIEKSATYELDLHICGGISQIPKGSYVKVAFGFPEGYGPEDKGVTFKVYHFKKGEDGKINPDLTEELNCVVTEYGIVVTVDNFSPFMVVAVKNLEVNTKNVYAKKLNNYGVVSAIITNDSTQLNVNEIASLKENESITYTITPNSDYQIDFVVLNKKIVNVINNTVTFSFDELQTNNEFQVAFVSKEVALNEAQNGIVSLNKALLKFEESENNLNDKNADIETNKKTIILICIPIAVILIAICAVTFIFIRKKKR